MGFDKVLKYALAIAISYAARGELASATSAMTRKAFEAMQHQQLSYGKFNRMLHSHK